MKRYVKFDPSKGYPSGKDLFYECLRCGVAIPSRPTESIHCKCRNIMIDVECGRLGIDDHSKARLFRTREP